MLASLHGLALLTPLASPQVASAVSAEASAEVVAGPVAARIDAFLTRTAGENVPGGASPK